METLEKQCGNARFLRCSTSYSFSRNLYFFPVIVVRFSSNGWMNDSLTIDYLRSIIGQFSFNKRLLVWDAYKCHVSQAMRSDTTRLCLHTAIVPGGCTKFIQAADVVLNTCFKSHMRSHDMWLAAPECHQYTKGGNMEGTLSFLAL